jgi:hypothetical protein
MHEKNEKGILCTRVSSLRVGATKTHLRNGRSRPTMTLSTFGSFLLAINTDLIYNISGSTTMHEKNEKSILCTRISSLCVGATKTHLRNGRSRPTMTLSTSMAILSQLSVQKEQYSILNSIPSRKYWRKADVRVYWRATIMCVPCCCCRCCCCACDCLLFCRVFFAE